MLYAGAALGADVLASSASLADVQAAVTAANDGDTVLIPNGSATWTSGINTTKQIIIRAQNYTPTPAGTEGSGATARSVTILNSSSSALFQLRSGNEYHSGIGGIRFNEGGGSGAHVELTGSGVKVPLVFDCYFQNRSRNWPDQPAIAVRCRGGVMWNCLMEGTQDINLVGEGSILVKLPNGIRDWETAPTMGTADSNGDWNFYIEDSSFKNIGSCPDLDDHGRLVARHFVYDGTWGATHGFTSFRGGRHWEYYDGVFKVTTPARNMSGRYFWCRAGTGVFTDNEVLPPVDTVSYGNMRQLDIGDNTPPGPYPQERAPGRGHDGTAHVSDPIYIWNQSGSRAYVWDHNTSAGAWDDTVRLNRDIYVNNGAKPGYQKFTYPHPFRTAIEGTPAASKGSIGRPTSGRVLIGP